MIHHSPNKPQLKKILLSPNQPHKKQWVKDYARAAYNISLDDKDIEIVHNTATFTILCKGKA